MFNLFKKKEKKQPEPVIAPTGELIAFCSGKVVPIAEVPDEVFAQKILGDGLGIWPEDEVVVAPADAKVTVTMDDSKHAIGLKLGNGMEILIHIGLDTVNMKGDGFSYFVNTGDSVKAGDKLISFSKKAIADAGHPDCIVMAISENADDLPITFVTGNDAVTGETVIANIG